MQKPRYTDPWARYGMACLLTTLATLGHWHGWPWVSSARFIFFYPAVTISAWFGGLGPGLLATAASGVLATWMLDHFLPDRIPAIGEVIQVGVFVINGTLLSMVTGHVTSRRRQLQERAAAIHLLEAEREKLREAVQARDEFLSIASHELKTPLTSLTLQAQMRKLSFERGRLDLFSPERLPEMLNRDVEQLKRLSDLVEDMLDISSITSGTFKIERSKVDLCPLVEQVIDLHRPQFKNVSCTLERGCLEEIAGHWDRKRLQQVLTNLLSNAAKYGGGKPVKVTVDRSGDFARVLVRDQGIGIPKESHERIFQRFERAPNAGTIAGLGLGLYIARRIVEAHKGTIAVQSEPGMGTTFIVSLPL